MNNFVCYKNKELFVIFEKGELKDYNSDVFRKFLTMIPNDRIMGEPINYYENTNYFPVRGVLGLLASVHMRSCAYRLSLDADKLLLDEVKRYEGYACKADLKDFSYG